MLGPRQGGRFRGWRDREYRRRQGHGEGGEGEARPQEGPGAAGQPAQVREVRGHEQPHLLERGLRPPQPQGPLLRQPHLRKCNKSFH